MARGPILASRAAVLLRALATALHRRIIKVGAVARIDSDVLQDFAFGAEIAVLLGQAVPSRKNAMPTDTVCISNVRWRSLVIERYGDIPTVSGYPCCAWRRVGPDGKEYGSQAARRVVTFPPET